MHAVAHVLSNPDDEPADVVRRRFDGLLGAMCRHRAKAGALAGAVDHFRKVANSYRPGLFHCYAVPDLPRTNNGLEQFFGSSRYHERRASGRKVASPGLVVLGSVRVISGLATRLRPEEGLVLGKGYVGPWRQMRAALEKRRRMRRHQRRFRRHPITYLKTLEELALQLSLLP